MNVLAEKTLSQIVTENHQAAGVFEKYGLDFCCKGKRPLKDAAAEKNIPVASLVEDLKIAIGENLPENDFTGMSMTELAEYIVRVHHRYVKEMAPQIFYYVMKVATKHGERYPHMRQVMDLFAAVKKEMKEHMEKEEVILFPRIKMLEIPGLVKGEAGYISIPVEMMESEHEKAGGLLHEIRELTHNYEPPADACTTHRVALESLKAFEEDLHRHVHLENNILFPKAIQVFETQFQQAAHG